MNKPQIKRHKNGVPHIFAEDEQALNYGIGYAHGKDRGMQILMMRILGQGRAGELLAANDETLEIDRFFRRMNWTQKMENHLEKLTKNSHDMAQCYCDGLNDAFAKNQPFETKLLKIPVEPYEIEHIFLISRMVGYLTLQQSQAEVERLFIELAQCGMDHDLLSELFPGNLKNIDYDIIKQIKLSQTVLPKELLWGSGLPTAMASNNWVVSGAKTASGSPLLSNDPHLEINRMPNVWHEIVASIDEKYVMGFSMPGLPGVLIGRNNNVSWGATYTFMDATDSWVEKIQDGKYETEKEGFKDFKIRKEVIKRKKMADYEEIFYENEHGTLDGHKLEDGYILTNNWSGSDSGSRTLNASVQMWNVADAKSAMNLLGQIETGWNWVIADDKKNIAYQMSGLYPKRDPDWNGFLPGLGWKSRFDWQGFVEIEDLPRTINPPEEYIVTANNDLNHLGKTDPINMPMGDYRAKRIESLLAKKEKMTAETFHEMHYDLHSSQAELFMPLIRPHIPDSNNGEILKNWDLKYDVKSKGADLFEKIYRQLIRILFEKNGVPQKSFLYINNNTGIFIDFYQNVDRILLAKNSSWFNAISKEELFKQATQKGLTGKAEIWGKHQAVLFKNLLFGEKFPTWFGFDKGPISLPGGRATIQQGQVYKAGERTTTFSPSVRFTSDMKEGHLRSNLSGGPSDRRFSKWYNSDTKHWLDGNYKFVEFTRLKEKKEFCENIL